MNAERFAHIRERFRQVEQALADPSSANIPGRLADLGREFADLSRKLELINRISGIDVELETNRNLAESDDDPEIRDLASAENVALANERTDLTRQLNIALAPADPMDRRDAIVEIRAGTGGEEAALFASDLLRMYQRYCDRCNLQFELLELNSSQAGGVKEAIAAVRGESPYRLLKYERGVHRVQRVPVTESSGRIHTSAASVAVLPEAGEVEVSVDHEDLRIDVFRSSGHGGQSVNTTDSAVRITHLPTGITVSMQDEKSQHKNRAKAMRILRSRLLERERERQLAERGANRRDQIGSGDRSAKMRTYNFPQDRLTDHRIGYTVHGLESIFDGRLEGLVEKLQEADLAERLAGQDLES
ncbi:MAG: peptide chain release factor 1 [Chloroflexota bacterium]|nr:peptide chain release factor 1 [Chloroflexota bacterium]